MSQHIEDDLDLPEGLRASAVPAKFVWVPRVWTCPRHGEYPENPRAFQAERVICPACMEAGKEVKEPWEQAWATYNRWQRTRVPDRFRNRRFTNYRPHNQDAREALAAARKVAAWDMQAIALIGDVGVGKTHLAIAILADVVRSGASGLWVHVPTMLRQWRACFGKGAECTEEQLLASLYDADVLVLDEAGATSRTEWEHNALSMLVDDRYRNGGRLVINGNLPHLAAGIGERGADRIDEMGLCIPMTGASYRSKAADDQALQVDDDFTKPPGRIEWTVCDAGVDRPEDREVRDRSPSVTGKQSHQPLRL